jgi:pimeloyl-ACP methyl ester carboxylesterase
MYKKVLALALSGLAAISALQAQTTDQTSSTVPVKAIAPSQIHVDKGGTTAVLPLYVSADWSKPLPKVTRALLVFHGKLRNADEYNLSGQKAVATAKAGDSTILITPQFLGQLDVDALHLPPNTLRWAPEAWMGGDDAVAPAAISSFDGIDAILNHLADRKIFPNLQTVVIAGHSGGGQVVQRYAVVGKAPERLIGMGVAVRYVVANPSSYVYFSPERPLEDGSFGIPKKTCFGKYNHWKFGTENPPPYVGNASFQNLETRFITRDVIYLLGTGDTDPNHPALDKTCSAEDEGAFRYVRGHNYFRYMMGRHQALTQKLWDVQGVEHDGDKMFNSPCGLFALFGIGSCPTEKTTKP